jgi:hypothetical protein
MLASVRTWSDLQAALLDCRIACSHCADTWLASSPVGPEALRCIRLLLDCSDLCGAAEELLPFASEISPPVLRSHLNTCRVACERCLRDVPRHRSAPLGSVVEACRTVQHACNDAYALLPTAAPAVA